MKFCWHSPVDWLACTERYSDFLLAEAVVLRKSNEYLKFVQTNKLSPKILDNSLALGTPVDFMDLYTLCKAIHFDYIVLPDRRNDPHFTFQNIDSYLSVLSKLPRHPIPIVALHANNLEEFHNVLSHALVKHVTIALPYRNCLGDLFGRVELLRVIKRSRYKGKIFFLGWGSMHEVIYLQQNGYEGEIEIFLDSSRFWLPGDIVTRSSTKFDFFCKPMSNTLFLDNLGKFREVLEDGLQKKQEQPQCEVNEGRC